MSRSAYAGPKLPKTLLDQVQGGRINKGNTGTSKRKEERRKEREQKKSLRARGNKIGRQEYDLNQSNASKTTNAQRHKSNVPDRNAKPTKSILKASKPVHEDFVGDEDDEEDGFGAEIDSEDEDTEQSLEEDEVEDIAVARKISKSAKARLEEDDAEIARLEKKLGMKGKSSKTVNDDELDWLVNGSDSEMEEGPSIKRKRPEDDQWLRDKRKKAKRAILGAKKEDDSEESEEDLALDASATGDDESLDESDGLNELLSSEDEQNDLEVEDDGMDDFDTFSDEDDDEDGETPKEPQPKRKRENPYVAPVSRDALPTKYIPPSLRQAAPADEETLRQLRRQIQGLLNRLSEANILSILQSTEQIYTSNARQHVTSSLIDLLSSRIADPSTLNDTFLILHAGFATAVYRIIGTDFIAQFVEDLVKRYDTFQTQQRDSRSEGKQTLNVLAFLSNLYMLNAIGSEMIFDYIRLLLDDFSEANTELLLRIIRTCGTQLRQDDPSSLKDIVLLLQRSIAKVGGEGQVSVRTKFMVETIMDLKNNRMKNGLGASALAATHVQGMKKTLGALSSSRNVKTTEPLRIGLKDLRDSEKKGKWWLVGASWRDPAQMARTSSLAEPSASLGKQTSSKDPDAKSDSDLDNKADLNDLARANGMNTSVRRAIFFALADAVSYQHAHERILKLNLKNKQSVEIPRVILRCAAAETSYNHYYTLVAVEFCKDHRLRKAWEFGVLDLWRRMGEEQTAGEESDEDDEGAEAEQGKLSVREAYNLAKLYAHLVSEGLLRITLLKALDLSSPFGLRPTTNVFVRVFLATILLTIRKQSKSNTKNFVDESAADGNPYESSVVSLFAHAHELQDFAPALRYYVMKHFTRKDIATVVQKKKEEKTVVEGSAYAVQALSQPPKSTGREVRKIAAKQDSDDEMY